MTVEAYAHCDAYKFGDKGTLLFIAFFWNLSQNLALVNPSFLGLLWMDVLSVIEFVLYGLKLIRDGKSIEQ